VQIEALAIPIQRMFERSLAAVPSVFGAILTVLIGWLVARIVRGIVSNFLATAGLDRTAEIIGVSQALGGVRISGVIGMFIFLLILIPFLASAAEGIEWRAVSEPVTSLLNRVIGLFPSFLAAGSSS